MCLMLHQTPDRIKQYIVILSFNFIRFMYATQIIYVIQSTIKIKTLALHNGMKGK